MKSNDLFQIIRDWCAQYANPKAALAMSAYMKNQFEFYGINAPARKAFVATFKQDYGNQLINELPELTRWLWNDDHRESQYIALDLWAAYIKKMNADVLPQLENMIITKSWWDTVDGIAPALVGQIMKRYPEARDIYIDRWIVSQNLWLQRSAIIFQLKYGKETDWDLLCAAILRHDHSKEFFIRKAQGWALRQYSRFAPDKVLEFVSVNPQLSGLTKKEALRRLKQ
jgi:3-methyladenine DNA glycosylase AlkD